MFLPEKKGGGRKKLVEVTDMLITFLVAMVANVFMYAETHQIVYIACAQLFVYPLHLVQAV